MTLADLVRATRQPTEGVARALKFLRMHGLVRVIMPAVRRL